jgi:hypothetical protein
MTTPYDLTHGLAQCQWGTQTQGPGNLRCVISKRGIVVTYERQLAFAVMSFLPTLEALCASFRLGRDRRFGAFQVVSLVACRACYCMYQSVSQWGPRL